MELSRRITLIIKVTNSCDMHCKYCFIEPSVFNKTMKVETARWVVHAFLDSDYFESVNFVWHGGEPLLRGRAFFEQVFQEQRNCGGSVAYTNATQTNATHLDDSMLDFLLSNRVSIGLSLDGPKEVTNVSRVAHRNLPLVASRGRRTADAHATTVDAARRLQNRGLPAGAIVTVNRNNVDHPESVYAEFRSRGIHMKVNPLTRSGLADTPAGSDLGVSDLEYGRFLVRLFDVWLADLNRPISIDPLAQHVARILGEQVRHSCFYTQNCHRFFLGISPDGDLFPCGMFQGEPDFKYGNILDVDPETVAATVLFGDLTARENSVLKSCGRCAFFDLCYGGCMFHSLKDSKVLAEKDYYCAGYKLYFEHLLRRVREDINASMALSALA